MRGISPALIPRLRAADADAGPMIEGVALTNEDSKTRAADFTGADGGLPANIELHPDGGIRLKPSIVTLIEGATVAQVNGFNTDLDGRPGMPEGSPFVTTLVEWAGLDDTNVAIERFVVYLHPRQNGANPKTVSRWVAQLFAVTDVLVAGSFRLAPLHTPVSVAATGESAADFTFDLSAQGEKARPKLWGPPRVAPGAQDPGISTTDPTSVLFVWAIRSDGTPADNVGLGRDSGQTSKTVSGNTIRGRTLNLRNDGSYLDAGGIGGLPRVKLEQGNFTQTTITWSTVSPNNRLNLGAVPTQTVEFFAQLAVSPGTSITTEVRNDADTAWVAFVDGDTTDGLTGVGKNQFYKVRATLTPNAAGTVTPRLISLGVAELSVTDFTDLATIDGLSETVDPFTGKAEIAHGTMRAIHDGEPDYEDTIRRWLSEHDLKNLTVRVFIGHPTLARKDWLPRARLLIEDTAGLGSHAELTLISPMVRLRQVLPKPTGVPLTRSPFTQTNVTLQAAYDELMDNQAALRKRFRGPGVTDNVTTISTVVKDSRVKDELDVIAFLAGGAMTGVDRITFVSLYGAKGVSVVFAPETIAVGRVTPGWSRRVPEVFLRYNWDFEQNIPQKERKYENLVALASVDVGLVDPPKWLDDRIGRWVDSDSLSDTLLTRLGDAYGSGEILIPFRSQYRFPELQLGDLVAVPTDRIIAKDPLAARALRGELWALCVLVAIHDLQGTSFIGWVRGFSDIIGGGSAVVEGDFVGRLRVSVYRTADLTINTTTVIAFNAEDEDVGNLHDNMTNNSRITIPATAPGPYILSAFLRYSGLVISQGPGPAFNSDRASLRFKKNGSIIKTVWNTATFLAANQTPTSGAMAFSLPVTAAGGDYFELEMEFVDFSGTGTITIVGSQTGTTFAASRVI